MHLPLDIRLKNNLIKRLCLGVQQSGIKGLSERCISPCSGFQERLKVFGPQQYGPGGKGYINHSD